jgi:RNA polymerase-binding transcription factor DksA
VIADIERAIARIRDGTYGSCESCTRPIAAERLEVLPYARLCVDCQGANPPLR